MGRVEGKVAIITGAARGQGAAEARLFAREGARVLLTDVEEHQLAEVAAKLTSDGFDVAHVRHDVADEAQWQAVVDLAMTRFGTVDILVNNAGVAGSLGPWEDATSHEFVRVLEINLLGQFYGINAVRPVMEAAGSGAIVNVSSVCSEIAFRNLHPAYASSKAGSAMLTKTAGVELIGRGIRVNSVHPGLTATPMVDWITKDPAVNDAVLSNIPIGRAARPEEVAAAALFLASGEASYITGAGIVVDGGLTAI